MRVNINLVRKAMQKNLGDQLRGNPCGKIDAADAVYRLPMLLCRGHLPIEGQSSIG
jgi:hypothetical protein